MRTDNIVISLINTEKYQEVLKTVPHKNVLDLSMVYRCITEMPEGGICSIIVNYRMLEKLNMTEDELHQLALENTHAMLPLKMEAIEHHFYVLSNEKRVFGAVGMFITDEIRQLAEFYESNLFIMPSSVHEVFVMPDFGQEKEYIKSVIEDANETVVREKDILSDSLYYYDYEEKELRLELK